MSALDACNDPAQWQQALVERWGDAAIGPIGWWNSLGDDDRVDIEAGRLDDLCRELSLVPVIAENTGRDIDAVTCERVACAQVPRPDRLLAWLGVL